MSLISSERKYYKKNNENKGGLNCGSDKCLFLAPKLHSCAYSPPWDWAKTIQPECFSTGHRNVCPRKSSCLLFLSHLSFQMQEQTLGHSIGLNLRLLGLFPLWALLLSPWSQLAALYSLKCFLSIRGGNGSELRYLSSYFLHTLMTEEESSQPDLEGRAKGFDRNGMWVFSFEDFGVLWSLLCEFRAWSHRYSYFIRDQK